jgi:predicted RNA methylase
MQQETRGFDFMATVGRARVVWHAHVYVRSHRSVAFPQNTKYRSAIRRAIQARGANAVDVLDVGTGTGLLALVCSACFNKSLHA